MQRCPWADKPPIYVAYHDHEWGVPRFDEQQLFEFLVLETFQAGLSWLTILNKRENFRKAFAGFAPEQVARFGEPERSRLLADAGIVRSRAKIDAAIGNARAFLRLQASEGSFADWIWGFVDGRPIQNSWRSLADVPAKTALSTKLSKELKRQGFKFVGPTVVYAHMQATGMVNDHLLACPRHAGCAALAAGL